MTAKENEMPPVRESSCKLQDLRRAFKWTNNRLLSSYVLSLTVLTIMIISSSIQSSDGASLSPIGKHRSSRDRGCYYMLQHYKNGQQIKTDEPCLNCTCENSMLMCYLRVCPYVKPVGDKCLIERVNGECCPRITCSDVAPPSDSIKQEVEPETVSPTQAAMTTTTTTTTTTSTIAPSTTNTAESTSSLSEVAFANSSEILAKSGGCMLAGNYYHEGAQMPSDPSKPCEVCYCIRNSSACVMQDCALEVSACAPIYNAGGCCPARYNCSAENAFTTPRPGVFGSSSKRRFWETIPQRFGFSSPDGIFAFNSFNSSTTMSSYPLTSTTTSSPLALPEFGRSPSSKGPGCKAPNSTRLFADGERVPSKNKCEHCYCMRSEIVCAVQECRPPCDGCSPIIDADDQCCPKRYECAAPTQRVPTDNIIDTPQEFSSPTTGNEQQQQQQQQQQSNATQNSADLAPEVTTSAPGTSTTTTTKPEDISSTLATSAESSSSNVEGSPQQPLAATTASAEPAKQETSVMTTRQTKPPLRPISPKLSTNEEEVSSELATDDNNSSGLSASSALPTSPTSSSSPPPPPPKAIRPGDVDGFNLQDEREQEGDSVKTGGRVEAPEGIVPGQSDAAADANEVAPPSLTSTIAPQVVISELQSNTAAAAAAAAGAGTTSTTASSLMSTEHTETSNTGGSPPVAVVDSQNLVNNERKSRPLVVPSMIPGEGSCRYNGRIYQNGEEIKHKHNCTEICMCVHSVVYCDEVDCPRGPDDPDKCQKVMVEGQCCPKYICPEEGTTAAPSHDGASSTSETSNQQPTAGMPDDTTVKPVETTSRSTVVTSSSTEPGSSPTSSETTEVTSSTTIGSLPVGEPKVDQKGPIAPPTINEIPVSLPTDGTSPPTPDGSFQQSITPPVEIATSSSSPGAVGEPRVDQTGPLAGTSNEPTVSSQSDTTSNTPSIPTVPSSEAPQPSAGSSTIDEMSTSPASDQTPGTSSKFEPIPEQSTTTTTTTTTVIPTVVVTDGPSTGAGAPELSSTQDPSAAAKTTTMDTIIMTNREEPAISSVPAYNSATEASSQGSEPNSSTVVGETTPSSNTPDSSVSSSSPPSDHSANEIPTSYASSSTLSSLVDSTTGSTPVAESLATSSSPELPVASSSTPSPSGMAETSTISDKANVPPVLGEIPKTESSGTTPPPPPMISESGRPESGSDGVDLASSESPPIITTSSQSVETIVSSTLAPDVNAISVDDKISAQPPATTLAPAITESSSLASTTATLPASEGTASNVVASNQENASSTAAPEMFSEASPSSTSATDTVAMTSRDDMTTGPTAPGTNQTPVESRGPEVVDIVQQMAPSTVAPIAPEAVSTATSTGQPSSDSTTEASASTTQSITTTTTSTPAPTQSTDATSVAVPELVSTSTSSQVDSESRMSPIDTQTVLPPAVGLPMNSVESQAPSQSNEIAEQPKTSEEAASTTTSSSSSAQTQANPVNVSPISESTTSPPTTQFVQPLSESATSRDSGLSGEPGRQEPQPTTTTVQFIEPTRVLNPSSSPPSQTSDLAASEVTSSPEVGGSVTPQTDTTTVSSSPAISSTVSPIVLEPTSSVPPSYDSSSPAAVPVETKVESETASSESLPPATTTTTTTLNPQNDFSPNILGDSSPEQPSGSQSSSVGIVSESSDAGQSTTAPLVESTPATSVVPANQETITTTGKPTTPENVLMSGREESTIPVIPNDNQLLDASKSESKPADVSQSASSELPPSTTSEVPLISSTSTNDVVPSENVSPAVQTTTLSPSEPTTASPAPGEPTSVQESTPAPETSTSQPASSASEPAVATSSATERGSSAASSGSFDVTSTTSLPVSAGDPKVVDQTSSIVTANNEIPASPAHDVTTAPEQTTTPLIETSPANSNLPSVNEPKLDDQTAPIAATTGDTTSSPVSESSTASVTGPPSTVAPPAPVAGLEQSSSTSSGPESTQEPMTPSTSAPIVVETSESSTSPPPVDVKPTQDPSATARPSTSDTIIMTNREESPSTSQAAVESSVTSTHAPELGSSTPTVPEVTGSPNLPDQTVSSSAPTTDQSANEISSSSSSTTLSSLVESSTTSSPSVESLSTSSGAELSVENSSTTTQSTTSAPTTMPPVDSKDSSAFQEASTTSQPVVSDISSGQGSAVTSSPTTTESSPPVQVVTFAQVSSEAPTTTTSSTASPLVPSSSPDQQVDDIVKLTAPNDVNSISVDDKMSAQPAPTTLSPPITESSTLLPTTVATPAETTSSIAPSLDSSPSVSSADQQTSNQSSSTDSVTTIARDDSTTSPAVPNETNQIPVESNRPEAKNIEQALGTVVSTSPGAESIGSPTASSSPPSESTTSPVSSDPPSEAPTTSPVVVPETVATSTGVQQSSVAPVDSQPVTSLAAGPSIDRVDSPSESNEIAQEPKGPSDSTPTVTSTTIGSSSSETNTTPESLTPTSESTTSPPTTQPAQPVSESGQGGAVLLSGSEQPTPTTTTVQFLEPNRISDNTSSAADPNTIVTSTANDVVSPQTDTTTVSVSSSPPEPTTAAPVVLVSSEPSSASSPAPTLVETKMEAEPYTTVNPIETSTVPATITVETPQVSGSDLTDARQDGPPVPAPQVDSVNVGQAPAVQSGGLSSVSDTSSAPEQVSSSVVPADSSGIVTDQSTTPTPIESTSTVHVTSDRVANPETTTTTTTTTSKPIENVMASGREEQPLTTMGETVNQILDVTGPDAKSSPADVATIAPTSAPSVERGFSTSSPAGSNVTSTTTLQPAVEVAETSSSSSGSSTLASELPQGSSESSSEFQTTTTVAPTTLSSIISLIGSTNQPEQGSPKESSQAPPVADNSSQSVPSIPSDTSTQQAPASSTDAPASSGGSPISIDQGVVGLERDLTSNAASSTSSPIPVIETTSISSTSIQPESPTGADISVTVRPSLETTTVLPLASNVTVSPADAFVASVTTTKSVDFQPVNVTTVIPSIRGSPASITIPWNDITNNTTTGQAQVVTSEESITSPSSSSPSTRTVYTDDTSVPTAATQSSLAPEPMSSPASAGPTESDYEEITEESGCEYENKTYSSAQQIPRSHPCDFCFCFRGDIICLQQTCPPPVPHCFETIIDGFCCPRYECPVHTVRASPNSTSLSLTPFETHSRLHTHTHEPERSGPGKTSNIRGCFVDNKLYGVGQVIESASGPCLECKCDRSGMMKCNPKECTPEDPLLQQINREVLQSTLSRSQVR